MIVYKDVCKKYDNTTIIDNLNLTIEDGEFIVLIGPSGCGKTTTLKMLNRLIKMNSGKIEIDGKDINEVDVVQLRRKIGYVIQQIGLFPNMTVEDNICVVPKLLKWSKEKCVERTKELLGLVDMEYEQTAKKYPHELSGGQQQRIGVLRALAANPPIVLMDEPFGALDPVTRDMLQDEIKDIHKKLKKTIVFVTHDMEEAVKLADRIVFMSKGEILQVASPEDMLKKPADPLIREFMGKLYNSTSYYDMTCADVMRKRVFTLPETKKTLECVELMKQKEIDSVIVVDQDKNYKGVVKIETINKYGKPGSPISEIMETDIPTVLDSDNAREVIDRLLEIKVDYIIVLNSKNKVKGMITKTSMTKSLASLVWGDSE